MLKVIAVIAVIDIVRCSSAQIFFIIVIFTTTIHDYKNSHPEMFCKKADLKNFITFTGIHLC